LALRMVPPMSTIPSASSSTSDTGRPAADHGGRRSARGLRVKRAGLWILLLGMVLGLAWTAESQSTHPEEVLDAPGGHPIAILLPGAARRIVEEKNGYARIVVEGWIQGKDAAQAGQEPGSKAPAESVAGIPTASIPALESSAPQAATSASLSGRVEIRLPSGQTLYGAGARVVLLGNVPELERRRSALLGEYQAKARGLEAEIEDLESQKKAALNSSENLTQATKALDQIKAQLAQKQTELQGMGKNYVTASGTLIEGFKTLEAAADPGGAYRLDHLAPGEYRVWGLFSDSGLSYLWYLPATIAAGKAAQLNLTADNREKDPFLPTP
jgi:hypothetical protein